MLSYAVLVAVAYQAIGQLLGDFDLPSQFCNNLPVTFVELQGAFGVCPGQAVQVPE